MTKLTKQKQGDGETDTVAIAKTSA